MKLPSSCGNTAIQTQQRTTRTHPTPIRDWPEKAARKGVVVSRARTRICSEPTPSYESAIPWAALPQAAGAAAYKATGQEATQMGLEMESQALRPPRRALTSSTKRASHLHWPRPFRICQTTSIGGEAVVHAALPVEAFSRTPTTKSTKSPKKTPPLRLPLHPPPPNHPSPRSSRWEYDATPLCVSSQLRAIRWCARAPIRLQPRSGLIDMRFKRTLPRSRGTQATR